MSHRKWICKRELADAKGMVDYWEKELQKAEQLTDEELDKRDAERISNEGRTIPSSH